MSIWMHRLMEKLTNFDIVGRYRNNNSHSALCLHFETENIEIIYSEEATQECLSR